MNLKSFFYKIFNNKHDPFAHMCFKYLIIFDQVYYHLVDLLMHFIEFLALVYFLFEDLLFHILSDEEQKLE